MTDILRGTNSGRDGTLNIYHRNKRDISGGLNEMKFLLEHRKKGKKEGELNTIEKGDSPLDTYHIDHLGPMTLTTKKYKYLLIIVDAFSKFIWIYPTKSTGTREVLQKLIVQQVVFGNPRRIITDKGAAFTSRDFGNYCTEEGIEHITITAGVPRGNGQVERINSTIISVLTKLSDVKPNNWYKHVDRVQRCINGSYQRAIKNTPFEVLFGMKMRQKEDIKVLEMLEEERLKNHDDSRNEIRQLAKENILKMQQENKRQYNKKCKKARK
ncbi:hypothetical protein O3M35_004785 [Rhynocoris fuscipes]|uniref:Integrase catalytic domain-containing protein n=1 Tax=Rhynocoris fuscipes TaxID=488301 RepID=A0AAW1DIA8_9HEMI